MTIPDIYKQNIDTDYEEWIKKFDPEARIFVSSYLTATLSFMAKLRFMALSAKNENLSAALEMISATLDECMDNITKQLSKEKSPPVEDEGLHASLSFSGAAAGLRDITEACSHINDPKVSAALQEAVDYTDKKCMALFEMMFGEQYDRYLS